MSTAINSNSSLQLQISITPRPSYFTSLNSLTISETVEVQSQVVKSEVEFGGVEFLCEYFWRWAGRTGEDILLLRARWWNTITC